MGFSVGAASTGVVASQNPTEKVFMASAPLRCSQRSISGIIREAGRLGSSAPIAMLKSAIWPLLLILRPPCSGPLSRLPPLPIDDRTHRKSIQSNTDPVEPLPQFETTTVLDRISSVGVDSPGSTAHNAVLVRKVNGLEHLSWGAARVERRSLL